MYKKWAGWKKVVLCIVGAATIIHGAGLAMAAEEDSTESSAPVRAEEKPTELTVTPTVSAPEKQITEVPAESAPEKQITETPAESEPEEQITETPAESEPEEQITEAPAESGPEKQITEAPAESGPEKQITETSPESTGETEKEKGVPVTGTVSHIDLSRTASAVLNIGAKTLTQTVTFEAGDLSGLMVSPNYAGAIVLDGGQIHIAGVFPVGTYGCPIEYTVSITKEVTFTDPDTGDIYTQIMTFSSSFNYWDAGNSCPGLGGREIWSRGFVIPWSGMDFCLGSAGATVTPKPTATPGPTTIPEPTSTPRPTETPRPTVTPEPTQSPGPSETPDPTVTPEASATPVPSKTPELSTTPVPSMTPAVSPMASPAISPTKKPALTVTSTPTPAVINRNTGNKGGGSGNYNAETGRGTSNATASSIKKNGNPSAQTAAKKASSVKTSDETKLVEALLLLLIALGGVTVIFHVLRLKHRREK